jgi:hypothetical protein
MRNNPLIGLRYTQNGNFLVEAADTVDALNTGIVVRHHSTPLSCRHGIRGVYFHMQRYQRDRTWRRLKRLQKKISNSLILMSDVPFCSALDFDRGTKGAEREGHRTELPGGRGRNP